MPQRAATIAIQLGLIAVVFAALPYKVFELDRYFVPKELALHIVALVVLVMVVARARSTKVDRADALLAAFLVASAVSTVFATNHWLAQRALSLSVASAVVFWGARRLGAQGQHRPILVGACIATFCAAITGLAQAYGLETTLFSLNRAPGGTFGNRNFAAHFCAIGLPAAVFVTVTAKRPTAGMITCAASAALLVLSRSRAAWLAVATCAVVLAFPLFASRTYWGKHDVGKRVVGIVLTTVVAVTAAVFLPNRLNWRSDSPYLDSALRVADYESGSGRGRIAQYLNSAKMAGDNPLLGVGPGNWPVKYVRFAPPSDASLTDDGMTANPWPSSDWVAFVSERGAVTALALAGAFALLFVGAFRGWSELSADGVLARLTLIATITVTLVVSAFDAVLLLAAPALLAWSVIGAASGVGRGGRDVTFRRGRWRLVVLVAVLLQGVAIARSATATAAIATVGHGGGATVWSTAAALDPGSYRINLRAAELQQRAGRCARSRPYARRARDLFPHAAAAARAVRACG
jgi:hypothetical protein